MPIDIKAIIADTLLELCEEKPLKKITILDIQKKSGISRQTFYNHFKDKLDLIQYIYENKIIGSWKNPDSSDLDYYEATLSAFKSDVKYHSFIKQACALTGTNCLVDFMYKHSREFDRAWYQSFHDRPLSKEMLFASDYHSIAGIYMRIQWILDDCPISPEQLLHNILQMRYYSLNEMMFSGSDYISPYEQAVRQEQKFCETKK